MPKCSLREFMIVEQHNLGHFGKPKTLEFLKQDYFCPRMTKDVERHVQRCQVCQKGKGTTTNVGLYLPLLVPNKPWECIGMNFVLGLQPTQWKNDLVMVVVDYFSKMAYFILCKKTSDASNVAALFFKEIYKLHGVPLSIVFDKDAKFLAHFWWTIWHKIGTELWHFFPPLNRWSNWSCQPESWKSLKMLNWRKSKEFEKCPSLGWIFLQLFS